MADAIARGISVVRICWPAILIRVAEMREDMRFPPPVR